MEDGNVNLLVPDGCERILQPFKKGLHSNDSNKLASEKRQKRAAQASVMINVKYP